MAENADSTGELVIDSEAITTIFSALASVGTSVPENLSVTEPTVVELDMRHDQTETRHYELGEFMASTDLIAIYEAANKVDLEGASVYDESTGLDFSTFVTV